MRGGKIVRALKPAKAPGWVKPILAAALKTRAPG
jgi:hypothetical protein